LRKNYRVFTIVAPSKFRAL